jgi:hypothetical protein
LDLLRNFEIALHRDTIRKLQGKQDEQRNRSEKRQVRHLYLRITVVNIKSGKHQKDKRSHEENAARRRKLQYHRPEQPAGDSFEPLSPCFILAALPLDLLRIKSIAHSRLALELKPELLNLDAVCKLPPKRTNASAHIVSLQNTPLNQDAVDSEMERSDRFFFSLVGSRSALRKR